MAFVLYRNLGSRIQWTAPPLVFVLQSFFFKLFGYSIYVEKFYSLLTFVISGLLIFNIWKTIFPKNIRAWWAILLWTLIPLVTWSAAIYILENTMAIFVLLSVSFYLKSKKGQMYMYLFLAGLSLSLAFLSKGFTGLFVLSLTFWYWIFVSKSNLLKLVTESFLLLFFTVVPLFLLFYFVPESWDSFVRYFECQVVGSLQHLQTIDNRFSILLKLLSELVVPVLVVLLVWFFVSCRFFCFLVEFLVF